MGELQFFVPGLLLELFEGSRSGGGGVRRRYAFTVYGADVFPRKKKLE